MVGEGLAAHGMDGISVCFFQSVHWLSGYFMNFISPIRGAFYERLGPQAKD